MRHGAGRVRSDTVPAPFEDQAGWRFSNGDWAGKTKHGLDQNSTHVFHLQQALDRNCTSDPVLYSLCRLCRGVGC